jgi:hypothetical protein
MAMEATISSTASARPGLPRVIVAAIVAMRASRFVFAGRKMKIGI